VGGVGGDLRGVDWPRVAFPGRFCGVSGLVKLSAGEALGASTMYGGVHFGALDKPAYGELDGEPGDEAAVRVICDNRGGTAAGQLASAYVIFARRGQNLVALGEVTPQKNPRKVHVTLLAAVRMSRGLLTVTESWYRATDADCCPSGRATTRWMLQRGRLVAGIPEIRR
jgi:hypothetical protein